MKLGLSKNAVDSDSARVTISPMVRPLIILLYFVFVILISAASPIMSPIRIRLYQVAMRSSWFCWNPFLVPMPMMHIIPSRVAVVRLIFSLFFILLPGCLFGFLGFCVCWVRVRFETFC